MRDIHITKLLEEKPFSILSEPDLAAIESHVKTCSGCLRAYSAAEAAGDLIKARAGETIEPSPFFKTRVMATIKERQLSPELHPLVRMWKAAGALVASMAALVVILVGLSIFSYMPEQKSQPELSASQSLYSPEQVVFERDDIADGPNGYDLVLGTVYDWEEMDAK